MLRVIYTIAIRPWSLLRTLVKEPWRNVYIRQIFKLKQLHFAKCEPDFSQFSNIMLADFAIRGFR